MISSTLITGTRMFGLVFRQKHTMESTMKKMEMAEIACGNVKSRKLYNLLKFSSSSLWPSSMTRVRQTATTARASAGAIESVSLPGARPPTRTFWPPPPDLAACPPNPGPGSRSVPKSLECPWPSDLTNWINLIAQFTCEWCKSSSNTVPPDWSPDPRIPALPQTTGHRRPPDNEVCLKDTPIHFS